MMIALLGLLAYKAIKGSGGQLGVSHPPGGTTDAGDPGGGLGDLLGGLLGGRPGGMSAGAPAAAALQT